jgi:hypothetical protein
MRLLPLLLRAAAAAPLLAPAPSHAGIAFGTNRSELIESPMAIAAGHWQFESILLAPRGLGARLSNDPPAPPTRLRVGITETMEFRAAGGVLRDETILESATDRVRRLHGFTDVSFGATWRVRGGDAGWLPGVAWLADVETTTGSPAFRGRDFRPSLRATAEWELPRQLSLGVMPGIYRDRDADSGRHYLAGILAVALGKAWTPRLQTFIEIAGEKLSSAPQQAPLVNVDTGLAFVATTSLRFNAVVSRCLAGASSQDVRGGLSVSARF